MVELWLSEEGEACLEQLTGTAQDALEALVTRRTFDAGDAPDLEDALALSEALAGLVLSSDTDSPFFAAVLRAEGGLSFEGLQEALGVDDDDVLLTVDEDEVPRFILETPGEPLLTLLFGFEEEELEELDEYLDDEEQAQVAAAEEAFGDGVGSVDLQLDPLCSVRLVLVEHASGSLVGVLAVAVNT